MTQNPKLVKTIIYMGTPQYAQVILQALLKADDTRVALVITQPDRPAGRKMELVAPPVKLLALEHGIEVAQPRSLREEGIVDQIRSYKPDFIIVAAFGQILPKNILDIAPCINLHASLLPQYRGASPLQQSLLHHDTYSGVTAMLMEEGLDSGAVLGYSYFQLPDDMRLHALMAQLSKDAAILTVDTIRKFENIQPIPQIGALASYCKKIKKDDGMIDFGNAQELYSRYRAFEGWPGVFTAEGLKILEMELIETEQVHRSSDILAVGERDIVIGCARGSVRIVTLQPPSKKPMDAKSYLVGRGLKVGDLLI